MATADTETGIDDTLWVPARQLETIPDWGPEYPWVTPEMAAKWLAESSEDERFRNRKVVPAEVRRLASVMRTNRWVHFLVTEPFASDEKGILINGKTRLLAVVESGVTCGFIMFRGVPREHFDYMGIGRPKNAAHVLYAHNMMSQPQVIVCSKMMLRYEEFLAGKKGREEIGWRHWKGAHDQPADVKLVQERRAEVIANYPEALRVRSGCRLLAAPIMLFMTYQWYAWPEGQDKLETFLDSLTDGSNMQKGSPALSLYNFGRTHYVPPDGRQWMHLILLFMHFAEYAKGEKLPTAAVGYGSRMLPPFHPAGPETAKRNLRKAWLPLNADRD